MDVEAQPLLRPTGLRLTLRLALHAQCLRCEQKVTRLALQRSDSSSVHVHHVQFVELLCCQGGCRTSTEHAVDSGERPTNECIMRVLRVFSVSEAQQ